MASSSQKVNMPSVESESNNVFVPHPTLGEGHLLPMGMYIQPATIHIGDQKVSGFKIVTKEQSGLADQSKLLVDDLLVAIDAIFIDQKMLEAVQTLFKTRSVTFSMTLIRQDKPAASDTPGYTSLKITIELVLGDTENVNVIVHSVEPEVLFIYSHQTIPSRVFSQELNQLTKYIKATNNTTVTMETRHRTDRDKYLFDVYLYNQVTGDKRAITFYNTKYSGSITVSEPEVQKRVVLEPSNPTPPEGPVLPTLNFFYIMSTEITDEFCLESVLKADEYITSEEHGDLKLETNMVTRASELPMKSRFLMTNDEGGDSLAASLFCV